MRNASRPFVRAAMSLLVLVTAVGGPDVAWGAKPAVETFTADSAARNVESAARLIRDRIETEFWTQGQSGPSCGVYAACRALSLLGMECNPGNYFTAEYLSNSQGSNPREVVSILESQGVRAVPMLNLAKPDIIVLGSPFIANVKRSQNATAYNHWVCVLYQHGRLMVFDGPSAAVEVPFSEFLSLWNGYAIVVSATDEPIKLAIWGLHATILIGFALLGMLLWKWWSHSAFAPGGSFGFLLSATLLSSLAGNWVFGDPLLLSSSGPVSVKPEHVDLDTFRQAASDGKHLVIDARTPSTFEAGFIKGAINIPVGTSPIAMRGLKRDIDRDLPVLIYCHSDCTLGDCHWSGAEFEERFGEGEIFLGFGGRGLSRGKFGVQDFQGHCAAAVRV